MRKLMAMVALAIAVMNAAPAFADEDLSQYAGAGWADIPQQQSAPVSSYAGNGFYRTVDQSTTPVAACTANLSVTPGYNVNARNGLPQTRFDSFVASSGYDDKIYGIYGDSASYTSWRTIGDGINESGTVSVYGLSTGHRSNLPTLQSDPGVVTRDPSFYNNSIDSQYHGGARM